MDERQGRESTVKAQEKRRLMSRRQALGVMGTAGVAVATWGCGTSASGSGTSSSASSAATTAETSTAAATIPSCILSPEVTEGPYYLEGDIVRANITEDREGIPLKLRVTVADADECVPLTDAAVDIWHCDAGGAYSGFGESSEQSNGGGQGMPEGEPPEIPDGASPGNMPAPPEDDGGGQGMQAEKTDDYTFLRGVQLTGDDGVAEFETIYPGWYQGRALHIHLKVMVGGTVDGKTYEGGHVAHTGQIFFPEDLNEQIEEIKPYSGSGVERVPNEEDNIFQQAGEGAIATMTPVTEGSVEDGFVAELIVGVRPDSSGEENTGEAA